MESGAFRTAAAAMRDTMDDELWTLTVDRSRTAEVFPDDILLLAVPTTKQGDGPPVVIDQLQTLTYELVTATCVPFLPNARTAKFRQKPTRLKHSARLFLGQTL